MGENRPSSLDVTPLHINKDQKDAGVLPSEQPRQFNPEHGLSEEIGTEDFNAQFPTFQNYLRAVYPFTSPDNLSPTTVTLSLKAGDIILVHSIHTNGWADGTLLENGARGWLPTNYCEAYEQVQMRPLLKALTEFWDLIRTGDAAVLDIFLSQDYMRGIIAGVRFLLERTRKALLSDLSSLVKIAKRLKDLATRPDNKEIVYETLDEMLFKAFKVVTRGVHFLDVWIEDLPPNFENRGFLSLDLNPPPSSELSNPATNVDQVTPVIVIGKDQRQLPVDGENQARVQEPCTQKSSAQVMADSSNRTLHFRRTSMTAKRLSIAHRISHVGLSISKTNFNFASRNLTQTHDTFLGVLAMFLGSHMQSRSSSELLLATQQAVKSCRALLEVVESVLEHDLRPTDPLLEAKGQMYDKITSLVQAAQEVFQPAQATGNEMIYLPDVAKQLVSAATACVRIAGECVDKTQLVLEQIGDFELQTATRRSSHPSLELIRPLRSPSEPGHSNEHHQLQTKFIFPRHSTNFSRSKLRLEIPSTILSLPELSFSSFPSSATFSNSIPATPITSNSTAVNSSVTTPRLSADDIVGQVPLGESVNMMLPALPKSQSRTIVLSTGSDSTYVSSSANDMDRTDYSGASTRATSPDDSPQQSTSDDARSGFSEERTSLAGDIDDAEAKLLEQTFAHELMFNKEGQVVGGTLAALIERLTAHDSTPDTLFVSAFYLTFRLFATPIEFAEALAFRFEYVKESPRIASPVRLRVYNAFKGWLECHWRHDCDDVALPFVVEFAKESLIPILPAAGKRLLELTEKLSLVTGSLIPRLVSTIGKTNTPVAVNTNPDAPFPTPIVSRSQLAALRTWKMGGAEISVVDFDSLELARQITLKVSSIFCSILPEELLGTEWNKQSGSLAVNVRAMSTLSTDLANLVADSILELEELKKRAATVKQWIKIARKCLDLHNYDSAMAIICSLNSSNILRLKKTWEIVSQKNKNQLEELSKVFDLSRNHVALRQRLQCQNPPCLPFVGMYLTDLTFVDHGNQMTRQLTTENGSIAVINFDKHMKTARIISELQRFQIPYRLTEVSELQTWMQDQLVRVRSAGEFTFQNHYQRSLFLEPRESISRRHSPLLTAKDKERFDFLAWTHLGKDKPIATHG